jgi:chromosome segregation ATPase
MQRQVIAAERSLEAAEESRRSAEEHVHDLEMRLSSTEEWGRAAEQAADRAQAQAANEVRTLEALAHEVRGGDTSAVAAIKEVQGVLAQLPEGSGTKDRLLAMQLGVAASTRELSSVEEAASSSESDLEEEAWLPEAGEDVLVCGPLLLTCRMRKGFPAIV